MTGTMVQLPRSLEVLIETRLDTIDRMLLGRVPRQDRLAIVREVESQIYDLLQDSEARELNREDVLAVLGRLDPPEAYMPEEAAGDAAGWSDPVRPRAASSSAMTFRPRVRKDSSRMGLLGGILGIVAFFMVVLAPIPYGIGTLLESEFVMIFGWGAEALLAFALAVSAIVLAICARMRGVWAIVGVVSGALSLLCVFVGGSLLLVELLG
jgi:hypothetical protein